MSTIANTIAAGRCSDERSSLPRSASEARCDESRSRGHQGPSAQRAVSASCGKCGRATSAGRAGKASTLCPDLVGPPRGPVILFKRFSKLSVSVLSLDPPTDSRRSVERYRLHYFATTCHGCCFRSNGGCPYTESQAYWIRRRESCRMLSRSLSRSSDPTRARPDLRGGRGRGGSPPVFRIATMVRIRSASNFSRQSSVSNASTEHSGSSGYSACRIQFPSISVEYITTT